MLINEFMAGNYRTAQMIFYDVNKKSKQLYNERSHMRSVILVKLSQNIGLKPESFCKCVWY